MNISQEHRHNILNEILGNQIQPNTRGWSGMTSPLDGVCLRNQGWFNIQKPVNVIHHIRRIKGKKPYDYFKCLCRVIPTPIKKKSLSQTDNGGISFMWWSKYTKNPTNSILNTFPLRSGTWKACPLFSISIWYFTRCQKKT